MFCLSGAPKIVTHSLEKHIQTIYVTSVQVLSNKDYVYFENIHGGVSLQDGQIQHEICNNNMFITRNGRV